MKILALDLGDRWTGSAISDGLGITARPYETVATKELEAFLKKALSEEPIETIVVGYPKTMKGTESEQTKKVVTQKEELEKLFPKVKWVLWDERLSSKRAAAVKKAKTKEAKLRSHSLAAASILQVYLEYLSASSTFAE